MKDYRVRVTVKNDRLLRAMEEMGHANVNQFCKAAGLSPSVVGLYVNMKVCPRRDDGEWEYQAKRIAEALAYEPDDLWSHEQQWGALIKNWSEVSIDETTMLEMIQGATQHDGAERLDRSRIVREMLEHLTPRERSVIEKRFGLVDDEPRTLAAIGADFGVQQERMRQIEARALHKMRKPSVCRGARVYWSNTEGEEGMCF